MGVRTETSVPKEVPSHREELIVDSDIDINAALANNHFPQAIIDRMQLVPVYYLGFDKRRHVGQIVVDADVAEEVAEIFNEIEQAQYPIKKVVPIVSYNWNDQDSINDNNTSAFNYRNVIGPGQRKHKLSNHSFGRAIDLNPQINPFVDAKGESPRPYDPSRRGTLTLKSPVVQIFLKYGWTWGGSWKGGKDYQHFEKEGQP